MNEILHDLSSGPHLPIKYEPIRESITIRKNAFIQELLIGIELNSAHPVEMRFSLQRQHGRFIEWHATITPDVDVIIKHPFRRLYKVRVPVDVYAVVGEEVVLRIKSAIDPKLIRTIFKDKKGGALVMLIGDTTKNFTPNRNRFIPRSLLDGNRSVNKQRSMTPTSTTPKVIDFEDEVPHASTWDYMTGAYVFGLKKLAYR